MALSKKQLVGVAIILLFVAGYAAGLWGILFVVGLMIIAATIDYYKGKK